MKVFVPFSEALIEEMGLSIGDLVPFQLEYRCLRMHEAGCDAEQDAERSQHTDEQAAAEVRA